MSYYQAKNLLVKTASYYQRQKEAVSKTEIRKKINEIKYLSAQKKVPKISLRKEIIHLENTLEGVFGLEKALLVQQKREAAKVNALKAEIAALKRLLAVSDDQDLRKKVNHITHILGEFKAQEETKKDVALSRKVAAEEPDEETVKRVHWLQERLASLKQELEAGRGLKEDNEIEKIEQKISLLEANLEQFYREHPSLKAKEPGRKPEPALGEKTGGEAVAEPEEGTAGRGRPEFVEIPSLHPPRARHTFILGGPEEKKEVVLSKEERVELEKELPLPPPPRK